MTYKDIFFKEIAIIKPKIMHKKPIKTSILQEKLGSNTKIEPIVKPIIQ